MNNQIRRAMAAGAVTAILACATPLVAQSSSTGGQSSSPPVLNPQRQGNSADDEFGLRVAYDSQRDYTSRMAFLADPQRQEETWNMARKFASCAVGYNAQRVRDLLDQAVESKKSKKVELGKFLNRNQGCVATYIGFDRDFLRGTMAEALVTSESAPAIPPSGDAESVKKFMKAVKAPSAKADDPFIVGQLAAECRTGFAPMQVRAVLATEPGSQEEQGALAALKAVTPQCASFEVANKPLTPYFERAFAAQALYHWLDLGPQLARN